MGRTGTAGWKVRLRTACRCWLVIAGLVSLLAAAGCATRDVHESGIPLGPIRRFKAEAPFKDPEVERRIRAFASEWYPRIRAVLGDDCERVPPTFDVEMVPKLMDGARGATTRRRVRLNVGYLADNPGELEYVMLHEMVHLAQGYRGFKAPVHWVEGIADAVPAMLGYTNVSWCPGCSIDFPHYTDGYRCAAAFLLYAEARHGPGIVAGLNTELRRESYSGKYFKQSTGRDLPALWEEFCQTPGYSSLAAELNAFRKNLGYVDGRRPVRFERRVDRWISSQADAATLKMALGYPGAEPPRDVDVRYVVHRYWSETRGKWTREAAEYLAASIRSGRVPGVEGDLLLDLISGPVPATETWPVRRLLRGHRPGDPVVYEFRLERESSSLPWSLIGARRIHPGAVRVDEIPISRR